MNWISVSDRLPNTEDSVLICKRQKNGVQSIAIAYYCISGKPPRWVQNGVAEITHWMPLPELPLIQEYPKGICSDTFDE